MSTAARRSLAEVKKVRKNRAPTHRRGSSRPRYTPKLQGEKGAVWDTPGSTVRQNTCPA